MMDGAEAYITGEDPGHYVDRKREMRNFEFRLFQGCSGVLLFVAAELGITTRAISAVYVATNSYVSY